MKQDKGVEIMEGRCMIFCEGQTLADWVIFEQRPELSQGVIHLYISGEGSRQQIH